MTEQTPAFQLVALDMCELAMIANIPIAFNVTETALIQSTADGQVVIDAAQVRVPYVKDHDALAGNHPSSWCESFDVTNWGFILARAAESPMGSVLIAWKTPHVEMLDGRDDLAVIWDLRVRPEWRGRGVGSKLIEAAADWACRKGCRELKVETQQINVAACRLYAAHGFTLREVRPGAYAEFPGEIQLLWSRSLE